MIRRGIRGIIKLVRKTVRPTVADGEVREETQVHLWVVREREDVEGDEKTSHKTTVRNCGNGSLTRRHGDSGQS